MTKIKKYLFSFLLLCTLSSNTLFGELTYSTGLSGVDDSIAAAIETAMAESTEIYNTYGSFNKSVYASYNSGVATADATYAGNIRFGGSRNTRVAMHEIGHTMGYGTYWNYSTYMVDGVWQGYYGKTLAIEMESTYSDGLHGDSMHIWPWGLNYDTEDSFIDRIKHVRIVAAIRCDMGLLSFFREAESTAAETGETATFSVDGVNGSSFRWYKDGTALSNTTRISGATTENLTITNVSLADEGIYYCKMDDLNSRSVHLYICRAVYNWQFEGNAIDSVSGAKATAVGTPSLSAEDEGYSLNLDGSSDALQLPEGIIETNKFTVATWVYWNGSSNWQRIFDFGSSTSQYMYLTPKSSSSTLRFGTKDAFYSDSDRGYVETTALTSGQWHHVAVTYNENIATLYVDGKAAATNTEMLFEPSKVKLNLNYIGKSQWSTDPYFNGKIDDFQVFTKTLTGAEVWADAGGNPEQAPAFISSTITKDDATEKNNYFASLLDDISYSGSDTISFTKISGPDWLIVSDNGEISGVPGKYDLGENKFSIRVSTSDGISDDTTIIINVTNINDKPKWKDNQPIRLLFSIRENVNIDLADYVNEPDVDDTLTFTVESAPDWASITSDGILTALPTLSQVGVSKATITVTDSEGLTDTTEITMLVSIYRASYSFNGNLKDDVWTNDCTASGDPSLTSNVSIIFDGSDDYVIMPENLANSDDITIITRIRWDSASNWQRIYDFGNGEDEYMFLTPCSGASTLKFVIKTAGNSEQYVETDALEVGVVYIIAVTISGNTASIYVNGELAASNTSFTYNPSSLTMNNCYLGKSQFSSDPMFCGAMDYFKIINTALSASQIANGLPVDNAPYFADDILKKNEITYNTIYTDSLEDDVMATEADTITYAKVDGPAWLSVSSDGSLSGTPSSSDIGINTFTVSAADPAGNISTATVNITVLDDTIVAHYKFDNDFSDLARNCEGSYSSTPSFAPGKIAQAIRIKDSGYITLPSELIISSDITIAGWLYPEATGANETVFSFGASSAEHMSMTLYSSGIIRFTILTTASTTSKYIQTSGITFDQWNHVAVTLSGNTAKIYINGVLKTTSSTFTYDPDDISTSNNYIGINQSLAEPFEGIIDDLRIYNYPLSLVQVQNLAKDTTSITDLEALAKWWLTSCDGNTDCQAGDINSDGTVNMTDFYELGYRW